MGGAGRRRHPGQGLPGRRRPPHGRDARLRRSAGTSAGPPAGSTAVRRTTIADWSALWAVRLRALAHDLGAFGSTHARALALPDDEYRRRAAARTTHLAWCDGEPVGIVTLVPDAENLSRAELVSVWLDPAHRSEGLGQRLVRAACALGRIDGVREVTLWVTSGNESARRLYERCGFNATGSVQPVRPGEPERLEEQMRRSLAAPPGEGADDLTRPDGVTGAEMLAELGHLLAEGGEEPARVDGAFVLRRHAGEAHDPPLLLHVGADDLVGLVSDDVDLGNPWPDAARERAALNLFLVHVDETIATRHDERRRHLVIGPRGPVCVPDPATPDEPPAPPPRIEVPPGARLAWTTGEPAADD